MRRGRWRNAETDIDTALAGLVAGGVLAPLAFGGDEECPWLDCDLASLAENRLGDTTDPRALDEHRRRDWIARATTEEPWPPSARTHDACYWLLDRGARAGTIAVAKSSLGGSTVRVASLYVFPSHRGRGIAHRALERLRDALAPHDLGVGLDTSWTWQRAVRFYLRIGMWVHSWKRDIVFWWHRDTPSPRITIGSDHASISVRPAGSTEDVTFFTATRVGDRLRLDEGVVQAELENLRLDAMSTLGVALALHGWPLVRSTELWHQCIASDLGAPESLAYKIVMWEAWHRKQGWRVETPRLAGLEYVTWDELEARWKHDDG